jgi:tetratricopeptide (TPR) repeat protein
MHHDTLPDPFRDPARPEAAGPAFLAEIEIEMTFRLLLAPLLLILSLTLSACESSEEKAERFYQSGLEYLAAGDEERALIEFRNVFKYNGFHKEARSTYAGILMSQGKIQEAYAQYLRLIEQYPDTPEVRQILAEIAIGQGNWDEAQRHGEAAIKLAPEKPEIQVVKLALDYRTAVMDRDEAARDQVAAAAAKMLETLPESRIARRIVIDRLVSGPDPQSAMPVIEAGLEFDPKAIELHMLKLRLLSEARDLEGVGAQLKHMYELFPDSQDVKSALISWYLGKKDIDGAEAFLRQLAGDRKGSPAGHLTVVQLLESARGPDAARAELEALAAENAGTVNAQLYNAMLASMDFTAGKQSEAIARMETILKEAEASDQTRSIKTILARMQATIGNKVGARALVEEVLAEDPAQVEALKMRAAWLIEEDKPGDAIVALRAALDQNPRDPEILTLMAAAHERDGSLDLAGERLAKAVEVSGGAAEESLRYAQFLLRQNRRSAALAVLLEARKVNPNDADLLATLSGFYVQDKNWPLAEEALAALKALNLPAAEAKVQSLQAAILNGKTGLEDSLAFLETEIASGKNSAEAQMLIVQAQLRAGKTAEARAYLDEALARTPEDYGLRLLSAVVDGALGNLEAAETQYRSLIAEQPKDEQPVRLLYGLLVYAGKTAEAAAVLDAGIAALPESQTLQWMKASALQAAGDIDGAIATYEALYAKDSSNMVVANNLASLITSYRDDPASLERAAAIARRLRGSEVPAFQDTYGWIESRRGNLDEALAHLEPAAKALTEDAMAQYHLGMTYAAAGRTEEAIRQLELALTLGLDALGPQGKTAEAELQKLKAAPPGQGG